MCDFTFILCSFGGAIYKPRLYLIMKEEKWNTITTGEPLNLYYPASGTVVNPRPAMILKTAPSMDNAKAFVGFLFSDEAQKLVADAYLLPGRSDMQCENRTNLSDIRQIPTDWDKMYGSRI